MRLIKEILLKRDRWHHSYFDIDTKLHLETISRSLVVLFRIFFFLESFPYLILMTHTFCLRKSLKSVWSKNSWKVISHNAHYEKFERLKSFQVNDTRKIWKEFHFCTLSFLLKVEGYHFKITLASFRAKWWVASILIPSRDVKFLSK